MQFRLRPDPLPRPTLRSLAIAAVAVAVVTALAPARAQGTPFRREVDGLIRALRDHARENGALGDGTCQQTAMALAAMGRSHRHYNVQDGPIVRPHLRYLFTCRQRDGSFGPENPELTSRWVLEALQQMDPSSHRGEIDKLRAWLQQRQVKATSPFVDLIEDLRAKLGDPANAAATVQQLGGPIAARVRAGLVQGENGKPDLAASVGALVELVALQEATRPPKQAEPAATADPAATAFWPVQQKAFDWLLSQQQQGRFGFRGQADAGLTAMGLAAMQTKPKAARSEAEQAVIDQGLAWLVTQQDQETGAFAAQNANYVTCIAVYALAAAHDDRFTEALKKAQHFVLAIQSVEGRGYDRQDRDYGSIGYGGSERGDLSNTQFALDALRRTGLSEQQDAFRKALVFLQRCQNVEGNDYQAIARDVDGDGEWYKVQAGNDGGAMYFPGNSPAGYVELPDGSRIPRSYGSMTYALLKAYTLCGLTRDDPRIQAAVKWIEDNWTLAVNPGTDPKLPEKFRYQGLYYYYMVLAQALDAAGIDRLHVPVAKDGVAKDGDTNRRDVDWRAELRAHVEQLQEADGSWVNGKNDRWMENVPLLCTGYAMLALHHCHPGRAAAGAGDK